MKVRKIKETEFPAGKGSSNTATYRSILDSAKKQGFLGLDFENEKELAKFYVGLGNFRRKNGLKHDYSFSQKDLTLYVRYNKPVAIEAE